MSLLYPPNPWYECMKVGHTSTWVCVPYSFWMVVRGLLHSMTTRAVRPDLRFFILKPEDCRCLNEYSTNFFSVIERLWWSDWGLNPWPLAQQTGALPTELTRQWLNISSNSYEALVLAHATLLIKFKQVLPHNFPIFFQASHPFRTPTECPFLYCSLYPSHVLFSWAPTPMLSFTNNPQHSF